MPAVRPANTRTLAVRQHRAQPNPPPASPPRAHERVKPLEAVS